MTKKPMANTFEDDDFRTVLEEIEEMNAEIRVSTPAAMSRPNTSSRMAAHQPGQAPKDTVDPLGKPNNLTVPCMAYIRPTRIRKIPSAVGTLDVSGS